MMIAVLTSLVTSAIAFAPAQIGKPPLWLMAFEEELSVQPPLGLFDPIGMLASGDEVSLLC